MRAIVLVAIVLLGGCKSTSPWDDGRYQLATTGEKQSVFLLDTRTGRVWEKAAGYQQQFHPIAILKDSSFLSVIKQTDSHAIFSYEPSTATTTTWGEWIQGLKK